MEGNEQKDIVTPNPGSFRDPVGRVYEENGLILRTEEEIEVAGQPAYKKGLLEKETNSAVLAVYFKKEDWGELYIFQVTSPAKNMRFVMGDAVEMLESFRFE